MDSDPAQGDSDPMTLTRSDQVQKPQNSDPPVDQEEQVGDFRLDSLIFLHISVEIQHKCEVGSIVCSKPGTTTGN